MYAFLWHKYLLSLLKDTSDLIYANFKGTLNISFMNVFIRKKESLHNFIDLEDHIPPKLPESPFTKSKIYWCLEDSSTTIFFSANRLGTQFVSIYWYFKLMLKEYNSFPQIYLNSMKELFFFFPQALAYEQIDFLSGAFHKALHINSCKYIKTLSPTPHPERPQFRSELSFRTDHT